MMLGKNANPESDMRTTTLLSLLLSLLTMGCALAHSGAPHPEGGDAEAYWPGPGLSGSWYDTSRSGEGFVFEVLADGRMLAAWFTYPATGMPGSQAWLTALDGRVVGNRVVFDQVYSTGGGRWGDAFDPAAIENAVWGSLEIEFHDCITATARYSGSAAHGTGELQLTRLTVLDELDCNGARSLTPSGGRALEGMRDPSGAWFVPARAGEGWYLENLPDGRVLLYWFTFDPQGQQAFIIGVGQRLGNAVRLEGVSMTRGAHFGADFDPADVDVVPFGEIHLTFTGCNSMEVTYASVIAGYGSGSRSAVRLSQLASSVCIDGTPQEVSQVGWAEHAPMPAPAQSELDAAVLDGKLYALGGFGDPRGFKRYDPASNQWTTLTPMPSGRDHLSAFAIDGGVFYTGGNPNGGGATGSSGYRYDVASATWEARPELPFTVGSRAALLNGRVYFGLTNGALWEYDPRQRERRYIAPLAPAVERDHAQVQAFLGEIWVIGGRFPETSTVAIYDPVTGLWRAGPRLSYFRAGFGASVLGHRLIIGGGEIVSGTPRLVPSVEAYTAGTDRWRAVSNLPIPVHGNAAGTLGNRTYFVSGSTEASRACCATGRLFSLEATPQ
jgi:hypothetical protein